MLGTYYYHQIFRKSIIAFGTVFNNIIVKRKDPSRKDKESLESYKCPIQYGPTSKYLAMIAAETTPERQSMQISLPRISFEIKGLNYDSGRKLVPTQFSRTVPKKGDDAEGQAVQYSQYLPVPYNLEIEMSIISKNQDDGLQVLEQILPHFHPSLNVSIVVIDETHEERDIAIVLNGVGYTDDYEGDYTTRRTLIWTLNFTVKTYLFGPVSANKDIRKVTLDYRSDIVRRPAELRYSAEAKSTKRPPVPREDIDPTAEGTYKVVETFDDLYSDDQSFFGLE
jgi:hypothetical protein